MVKTLGLLTINIVREILRWSVSLIQFLLVYYILGLYPLMV
jgi:hypothetical protein